MAALNTHQHPDYTSRISAVLRGHQAEIWAASRQARESGDCTVKAVAVTTGLDYETVHAAFAKAGRKPRKGVVRAITAKAVESLGYEMTEVTGWTAKTAITIERDRKLQQGRYVIGMTRHLAGMVDGKLIDWTEGKRKRIEQVYRITKSEQAPAPLNIRQPVEFKPIAQTNTQLGLFV